MCRNEPPLVSVVVPAYDRPALLAEAVRSVVDQTYDRIEVVVVDDGSTADLRAALDDVPVGTLSEYQSHRHPSNRGANAARNTGIAAATGEYVAFLDDDDYWEAEKVERQVAALRDADDRCAVAFTGQRRVDENGTTLGTVTPVTDGEFLANLAAGATFGPFSTVMVEAEVFEETGELDERFPCWQDREWYFRLAEQYDWVAIPDALTVRRSIEGAQISDGYERKRDVAYPLLVDKHGGKVADLGRSYERRFLASFSRGLGLTAAKNGFHRESLVHFGRAIGYHPTAVGTYGYLLAVLGGGYTFRAARVCRRAAGRTVASLRPGTSDP
ncbi:glycosyltransferase family 2 protein [Halobaculum rarum]|uniref:glycosyltransferase family 2 protein n=1 Tax=Halobaculum rarum TaxID=3075122 RepID=UPI0032AEAA41